MPDLQQIGGWAAVGGLVTTLAATWRFFYVEIRRDRDFWRDMALGTLGISERATKVAETAVKHGNS